MRAWKNVYQQTEKKKKAGCAIIATASNVVNSQKQQFEWQIPVRFENAQLLLNT